MSVLLGALPHKHGADSQRVCQSSPLLHPLTPPIPLTGPMMSGRYPWEKKSQQQQQKPLPKSPCKISLWAPLFLSNSSVALPGQSSPELPPLAKSMQTRHEKDGTSEKQEGALT